MTNLGPPELLPASLLPSNPPASGAGSASPGPQEVHGEPGGAVDDHDRQHEDLLNALTRTIHHFYGGIRQLFKGVDDPRQASKIEYPLIGLLTAGSMLSSGWGRGDRSPLNYEPHGRLER